MNVAFLLTAYHQPLHLSRLVHALWYPWARFFVHVDARKDIKEFTSVLAPSLKITYLEGGQRQSCFWGGFGLVQATLNLIKAAVTSGNTFDRFCLLSGSDYPLKGSETLFNILNTNQEFLDVERRIGAGSAFVSRTSYYSFRDYPLLHRLHLSGRIPRREYNRFPLYGGSGWWSLTGNCMRFALEFIREQPSYLRYARFADIPDEMFFHSIVKASPFAEALSYDFERPSERSAQRVDRVYGSHYVDWKWRTAASHPKVLDMSDWPNLKNSCALFARKFEQDLSGALLEQIDKWRSSKNEQNELLRRPEDLHRCSPQE